MAGVPRREQGALDHISKTTTLKGGMKMKKAVRMIISLTLTAAMALSMTGCGGSKSASSNGGKVFNIYCWNEEFKSRVTDHYPGYEEVDATTGKIGDVTVKWNITPNQGSAYQDNLDQHLLNQEKAAADDKIDLFLIEADYALKYINSDYALPVKDLGIKDEELADQYKYTKDIVTDSKGVLKGVSWQGCPGVMIYNREIAKDVFGTDDPETVQAKVKDWDTYNQTAKEVAAKGHFMTSSFVDPYRVFSNNVSGPWVQDGKIVVDENINQWINYSKEWVDEKATNVYDLWDGDTWGKGFYPEGNVFCYFGPAWFIDFCMAADDEASIAHQGGWAACEGPQGFYWGGTWICGCKGTDNADLVADIMRKLTTDKDIMTDIVNADNDFVNNKPAMEALAADPNYQNAVLGGQNPLPMFCAGAEKIDLSNLSPYDQGCNEKLQEAMKNYLNGNGSLEESMDLFYKAVEEMYPEVTH